MTPEWSFVVTRYATPAEVREMLENQPDSWIECRGNRHPFEPSNATSFGSYGILRTVEVCANCTAVKTTEMTLSGKVLTRRIKYVHPEYLSKTGKIAGDARDMVRLVRTQKAFKVKPGTVAEGRKVVSKDALAQVAGTKKKPVKKTAKKRAR